MDSILYYLEKTSASSYLKFSIPFSIALFLAVVFVIAIYTVFKYIIIPAQKKHAQEMNELEMQHAKEQALMFMNGVEQERKRIAMDLHDNIIQTLSAANIRLEILKHNSNSDQGPLNEVSDILRKSTADIRDLINNITPADLSTIGFQGAVNNYLRSISRNQQIKYNIDLKNFPGIFDSNTNLMLYRIIQEILNNIEKHSQATEAGINCSLLDGQLIIEAKDNGKGFSPGNIGSNKTEGKPEGKPGAEFGLSNIAYRVSLLNGEIEINSGEGKGTTLKITIPLPDNYGKDSAAAKN